jgi:hypothetical protein
MHMELHARHGEFSIGCHGHSSADSLSGYVHCCDGNGGATDDAEHCGCGRNDSTSARRNHIGHDID